MAKTTPPRVKRVLIEAMAKHLPPSAAHLRLLDVENQAGEVLSQLRPDLEVQAVAADAGQWSEGVLQSDSADSVVAFGALPDAEVLAQVLRAMRPGGRLIVVDPHGEPEALWVQALEAAGFTRILVETAAECPLPTGVLMRGEKPHTTEDTLARVQQVAGLDADLLDLASYNGRYLHLLIQETPNKPVWARQTDDVIRWQAVAVERAGSAHLLAFSSLPKAVAFMQPAVLQGRIRDINKVAKFSLHTAQKWVLPVVLNPMLTVFDAGNLRLLDIDPSTAETPDE